MIALILVELQVGGTYLPSWGLVELLNHSLPQAWNDAVELTMRAWDLAPTEVSREVEEVKSSALAQSIQFRERGGGGLG